VPVNFLNDTKICKIFVSWENENCYSFQAKENNNIRAIWLCLLTHYITIQTRANTSELSLFFLKTAQPQLEINSIPNTKKKTTLKLILDVCSKALTMNANNFIMT
jgi:hypothetical protein